MRLSEENLNGSLGLFLVNFFGGKVVDFLGERIFGGFWGIYLGKFILFTSRLIYFR